MELSRSQIFHLKYSLDIVITVQHCEHVTVCQEDAGVVDNRGPGDHPVGKDLHHVLDCVHGRHIDHDLWVLLVVGRVKQVYVLPAQ